MFVWPKKTVVFVGNKINGFKWYIVFPWKNINLTFFLALFLSHKIFKIFFFWTQKDSEKNVFPLKQFSGCGFCV